MKKVDNNMFISNEFLVEIINRIRKCPFLEKYSDILKHTPSIGVKMIEGRGARLKNITFSNWDEIIIDDEKISFNPEYGPRIIILEHGGWEDLYETLDYKKKR